VELLTGIPLELPVAWRIGLNRQSWDLHERAP
jgi:hypothetical protein